jgi:hypothetical protein
MQPLPRHPGKPSGFGVMCTSSADDLSVTKQTITYEGWPSYTVSSVEFEDGDRRDGAFRQTVCRAGMA